MLTVNYKDLQYKHTKQKKKNKSLLVDEKYPLGKSCFASTTWKEYKEWLKAQKPKEVKKQTIKKQKTKKVKPVHLTYNEQLKDIRWLNLRKQVMDTKGYVCAECGARFGLQVHHLRYIKGKMAWEYPMSDLVVLCEKCHKKIHGL